MQENKKGHFFLKKSFRIFWTVKFPINKYMSEK